MSSSRPRTHVTSSVADPSPALPARGEEVLFVTRHRGQLRSTTAIVLAGYASSASVDLAILPDGEDPQLCLRLERFAGDGDGEGWARPGDLPPPPPTPEELIAAAVAEGRRVPEIGQTVTFLQDSGGMVQFRYEPRRARVVRVHGPELADLEVFDVAVEADDPRQREPGVLRELVRHGVNGAPRWCFRDEITLDHEFPWQNRDDFIVDSCDSCNQTVPYSSFTHVRMNGDRMKLCESCSASIHGKLQPESATA